MTRIVDRTGRPYQTVEMRERMGFLGGDLLPECSEPPTLGPIPDRVTQPRVLGGCEDETTLRRTRHGT